MRSDGYQTKGKKIILEFLEANKDTAVSVQNIADYLKASGEETNITTVYRRLEKLAEEKKVIRHSAEDGKKRFFSILRMIRNV